MADATLTRAGSDVREGVPPPAEPDDPVATPTARPPSGTSALPDSSAFRRPATLGAVTGFVVTVAAVTVAGVTLGDMAVGHAAGLGAFVGGWGGAGFGFLLGASLPLVRHHDPRPAPAPDAAR